MRALSIAIVLACPALAAAQPVGAASAQPERGASAHPAEGARAPEFGARAQVEPPIAAGSDVDPSASATSVELEDRPRALETIDEVVLEVPGARRRRIAGFGGFTSLSLRGAEAEHTQVLIGEVPISSADGSALDLSSLPPWLFGRIEVFRGGAPVWLGAGAIGGVLRLVPRSARGTRVEGVGGGGSWDLAQGRIAADLDSAPASISAVAGLTHSAGGYPLPTDRFPLIDGVREQTQSNAQLLEASGLLHLRARSEAGTFSIVALGLERIGGVPPPPDRLGGTSIARRAHTRGVLAISAEWLEGGRPPDQADLAAWRAQLVASIGAERRSYDDLAAQSGQLPRAADQRLVRTSLRGATSFRIAEWISATIVASAWREHFDPSDALARYELRPSWRDGGTLAAEARIHGREGDLRWELRPSARMEVVSSHTREIRPEREGERIERLDAMPTARLGAVIEIVPGIAIQLSGATATRTPSPIELFGDNGLLLGNARLGPETSRTIDGGLVMRGGAGPLTGLLELRGFGLWLEALIRPRRIEQGQVVFENVASAWTAGIEASARASFERWVSLVGAITWMENRDETSGLDLPYRPRLSAYVRPAVHTPSWEILDRASLYIDLDYVAAAFNDPANTTRLPEQIALGAGISLELFGHVRIDAITRNLLDARFADLTGRVLPGRSFAMQVAVRTD